MHAVSLPPSLPLSREVIPSRQQAGFLPLFAAPYTVHRVNRSCTTKHNTQRVILFDNTQREGLKSGVSYSL